MSTHPRKIGLLGGSFDPVHLGHMFIGLDALEALGLDEIWYIPAARSPHKAANPLASDVDRVAMLRCALAPEPRFRLWAGELELPPPSYTWRTLEKLITEHPDARFFWIIGADQFQALPRWSRIEHVAALVEFAVLARPGYDLTPPAIPGLRHHRIEQAHPIGVSSTEIRERAAAGKSIDFMLPPGVGLYLREHALYVDIDRHDRT
ncbi:MAG: nicotinate-nucleotide adenylyltransferase [Verrucomicrobiota bacterium JB022]|nr:nicotinate-nucleotide adenylyltransferase [Verrucomicrobiota bacterium JB022]